jgi:hypothetical protein
VLQYLIRHGESVSNAAGRVQGQEDVELSVSGREQARAVAACDEAGDLVGILQPHASGQWRLRPNFRGVG